MDKRILALDVGDVRIGVAVSDSSRSIAMPLSFIEHIGKKQVARDLEKIIEEYDIGKIVMGLPLHMNGDFGESALKCQNLGDYLSRRFKMEVDYQDERMTTLQAESVLIEGGVRREKRKNYIDSLSAVFILESYLNRLNK